jgi:uncharacterized protein YuzE
MKIRYFTDTDTLYVELNDNPVAETREINENTLIDLDTNGNLVSLTVEHARGVTDLSEFSLHQIVSQPA